ncbi:MAG: uroporphyrinogen decarboxylase [Flavobacteriaceae bacterium CG_4_10_14_3_um_filter_33_47]|nr:MAG: uroporphyrinogen decarboxylase [Flavobacteriaceae bacterium CG17_big_fil_post_rev_8_21_14_2_50_33_15]PIY11389.1 MAG: uroporphyrinogen decarboxylase [Flavobacteriaceae bacterium CG_4_10_14_3_um_filter_33_47]PJB19196.1 MAG: uroporphyrinogen decarboxylase [Flavobacteriaceae bacterium CG_4_9_14_3_um_filter_33_16]
MDILGISISEWVGYFAMATVLISFTMKSVIKLRIVNSFGCLIFVIYGFMLQPLSKPIIITNAIIFAINIYYLFFKKN